MRSQEVIILLVSNWILLDYNRITSCVYTMSKCPHKKEKKSVVSSQNQMLLHVGDICIYIHFLVLGKNFQRKVRQLCFAADIGIFLHAYKIQKFTLGRG